MRAHAAGLALCAVAAAASAHAPTGATTATNFPRSFEPWVVALLLLAAALHAAGLARLWRHAGFARGLGRAQAAAWVSGWLTLVAALVSPLDPLGERLFSAHMLQHELLMIVAAPLLVVSRPLAAWAWALRRGWRGAVGGRLRRPGWRAAWSALTHPLSAWSLHAIALWGWHLPGAFDAALVHPAVHALQHFSFLGTALLFWWSTLGSASRCAQAPAMLSLFTTMAHTAALGALMTLSPLLSYPHYAATSAALGLDSLEDQQVGGLVMWVPASAAYLCAGLAIAARWLRPARAPFST